jgi:outer membrane protein insertion porin family
MLKFASGILLSETEFIKAVVQSSWYFQLRRGLVFAFSFKGGAAHGLGESAELPLIERFFLGGRNTVRGYTHDTLGPKGAEDNPTGGNAFVLFNTEFRISLGRGFGLVAFVDSGNVWKKISNVSTELRYTTGLGLRYNTPIGPVRIDYGYKLNRERGESAGEIHFSLGHAF